VAWPNGRRRYGRGWRTDAGASSVPGMARSVSGGCPSTVKGHPKILSKRFAESIFGTRPLSGGA